MKRRKQWLSGVLTAAMVMTALPTTGTVFAKQPAAVSYSRARAQVDALFGVKTTEKGSKRNATYEDVASQMAKDSSLEKDELLGAYAPKKTVTEAGLKKMLNKRFPNVLSKSGVVKKKGNVIIKKGGVTLKNTHVRGSLIIAEGVGKGSVTLSNVKVDQITVVRGGGKNSVNVQGESELSNVILQNKKQEVAFKIDDKATVRHIEVADQSKNVTIKGGAEEVSVKAPKVRVSLQEAKIKLLQVTSRAEKTVLLADKKTQVQDAQIYGKNTKIKGEGSVANLAVHAEGLQVDLTNVETLSLDKGIKNAVVNGENKADSQKSDEKKRDETKKDDAKDVDPKDTKESSGSGGSGASETAGSGSEAGQQTQPKEPEVKKKDLSYEGYQLKWADEFDGNSLDRSNWNVELHDPKWVNDEQQAYVDSEDNIQVKDGALHIRPKQVKNSDGSYSYTSGRVNTQGHQKYKYGLFEARVKVPKTQGYLPAFWMMPEDESLYGQWPKCGEIDCMEVMGQNTKKAYGTIHYGTPHKEDQGTCVLTKDDYGEAYHTFDLEWFPDHMNWYMDGILYHTTNRWYTARDGKEKISYPAPFDQDFYIILNLAVGGSWVGYTDETTDFAQEYAIDYVRVYQKDSYDTTNINIPEEKVETLPVSDQNLLRPVTSKDWTLGLANGGDATMTSRGDSVLIQTKNKGTVDYSVQPKQSGIQLDQLGEYEFSFDAYASEDRTLTADLCSPDNGWAKYPAGNTVHLTTEKQHFSYTFTMTGLTDKNCQAEFNMGNGDTADVIISNVKLVKTGQGQAVDKTTSDGNYVFNGGFQEGKNYLGNWDISGASGAKVYVTNDSPYARMLSVTLVDGKDALIRQSGLHLKAARSYKVSLLSNADLTAGDVTVTLAGAQVTFTEKEEKVKEGLDRYTGVVTTSDGDLAEEIVIKVSTGKVVLLDDVSVVTAVSDDNLLKNGNFEEGLSGWGPYVDSNAAAELTAKEGYFLADISNTGKADWQVQLKQAIAGVKGGHTYKLSFEASSTVERPVKLSIQRDKGDYKGFGAIDADLTQDNREFFTTFTPEYTDCDTLVAQFSLGAKTVYDENGQAIPENTPASKIKITNVKLVDMTPDAEEIKKPGEVTEPSTDGLRDLLADALWEKNVYADQDAEGEITVNEKKFTAQIVKAGKEEWAVQIKTPITGKLEAGKKYCLKYTASSTAARSIKVAVMEDGGSYTWIGGGETSLDESAQEKEVCFEVTREMLYNANGEARTPIVVQLSLGKVGDDVPASTITIENITLTEVE